MLYNRRLVEFVDEAAGGDGGGFPEGPSQQTEINQYQKKIEALKDLRIAALEYLFYCDIK